MPLPLLLLLRVVPLEVGVVPLQAPLLLLLCVVPLEVGVVLLLQAPLLLRVVPLEVGVVPTVVSIERDERERKSEREARRREH